MLQICKNSSAYHKDKPPHFSKFSLKITSFRYDSYYATGLINNESEHLKLQGGNMQTNQAKSVLSDAKKRILRMVSVILIQNIGASVYIGVEGITIILRSGEKLIFENKESTALDTS